MNGSELKIKYNESKEKAFRAIFDEYFSYVYAIAVDKLRNCGTREDIDECVSDVFADVFRSFDFSSTGGEDIKGFIGVLAKRRAVDTYRRLACKNGRTVPIEDEAINSDTDIEENADVKERNKVLLAKVYELGEPDSMIIIQQFFYNRTSEEIGKIVSMTAAAVRKRSQRARKKLKVLLCEAGITI